jgi:hypothetical protein
MTDPSRQKVQLNVLPVREGVDINASGLGKQPRGKDYGT